MLVFGRRKNQQIVVDKDIVVTVLDIRGETIRLGIEAPRQVPVYPRELCDAICEAAPAKSATRPRA
ncbi:MAG: carbon storage regulator [Thermoguttaceae bacterium]